MNLAAPGVGLANPPEDRVGSRSTPAVPPASEAPGAATVPAGRVGLERPCNGRLIRRGSLEQRSDEELMLAYRQGDLGAFETLLRRHQGAVFGFAHRLLGNRALAEEAAQEGFLRVIRASGRYTAEASFRNYLYRIVRNVCLDLLRKQARTPQAAVEARVPGGCPDPPNNHDPGPEAEARSGQVRRALNRALRELPPEQREVFLLKEVRDLKLEDVARITGTNLNTVKSRLRYALAGLRERLTRAGVGGENVHDL